MASAARLWILLLLFAAAAAAAASLLPPSAPQRRRLLQSTTSPPSRNLETFFPSNAAPAFTNPAPPPPRPPPASPFLGPAPSSRKSSGANVAGAVAATAASTFVVSGLLFFALHRFAFKRRRVEGCPQGGQNKLQGDGGGGGTAAVGNPYEAARVNGMLKAVLVDEDGLDVLYWRKLEDGTHQRRCVHCMQVFGGDGDDGGGGGGGSGGGGRDNSGRREQASGRSSRRQWREGRRRVQETPLLPADSLSSSDRIKLVLSTESERSSMSVGDAPMKAAAEAAVSGSRHAAPSSPRLPLPPGRRGSVSKFPSHSSSSSSLAPPTVDLQPPSSPKRFAAPPPPPPPPPPTAMAGPAPPAPPPPRPPPVGNKIPGPPARPAPTGSGRPGPPQLRPPTVPRSSSKTAPAEGSEEENARAPTKLRPLHWDKMTTAQAQHSMVWDKISNGSFRFDDNLMEALFGYVATNRKSPKKGPSSSNPFNSAGGGGPPGKKCLLDPRKSQNTAIVLKSLAVTRQEILDALMEGRGLSTDTLEKLCKLAPSKEEEELLLRFSGDPSSLADAESFLFHLLRAVPSAFPRVDALLFKAQYEPEVVHLRESLQALGAACKELRKQGLFWKMLEAVLKAGNRMNAGTARGNAQAFNLSSLRKLSDVKSIDGKTTLLHFVVESVVRSEGKRCVVNRNHSFGRSASRSGAGSSVPLGAPTREEKEIEYMTLGLPVVGGLSNEFANVKKAAAVDYDALVGTCSALGARAAAARNLLATCGGGDGGFVGAMSGLLERAEGELKALREEQARVVELVRKTTEYYMVGGAAQDRSAPPLQLFIVVKDFLGMVDQACVDIARNLQQQKRKPASAGDSPAVAPRKRTVARFPNLPAHFMSENSKSSSRGGNSDSDSDSEGE